MIYNNNNNYTNVQALLMEQLVWNNCQFYMYIRLRSGSDGAASLELIVQSFTFTTCHVHTCAKVVAKKQDCGVLLFVWELSES